MSSQEYKVIYAKQHGFTLIEVLIAIAITAAVMVAVSATFITTLRSHREVEGSAKTKHTRKEERTRKGQHCEEQEEQHS